MEPVSVKEIAQTRGAANLMGKDWGAIVTWKYTYPESVHFPGEIFGPYLPSGNEIYVELKQAYEAGAKYLIVFNFPTFPAGNPYGTLQQEHFSALQRLWTEVIQNQTVINGGIKAEAALVLPANYGWGMRNPVDNIWGLWQHDEKSPLIWNALQNALADKNRPFDIVYDDANYPVTAKYSQLLLWNQTS